MGAWADLKKWFTDKQPSKEELTQRLLAEQTKTFYYLVEATNVYLNLVKKYPKDSRTPAQAQLLKNYLEKGFAVAIAWDKRQKELEKAGAKKFILKFFDFTDQAQLNKLAKEVKTSGGVAGIGFVWFVPLLWFSGVSLVAWATTKITDDLTTTAKEQEELINTTKKTCLELKLSPEDCKKLITDTQAGVDNSVLPKGVGGIGFLPLLLGAGLIFFLMKNKK